MFRLCESAIADEAIPLLRAWRLLRSRACPELVEGVARKDGLNETFLADKTTRR
ncbi:hypothetical protein IH824_17470 [candidate division KSB1 bacterium]|nr:hypothetical protein [candidate division KSB1 bacterium]MCH8874525.1 hypothetical protein [candidate division KSB1 bacterium]